MTKQPKWHLPNTDCFAATFDRALCGRKTERLLYDDDYAAAIDSHELADGRKVCERCRDIYDFGYA